MQGVTGIQGDKGARGSVGARGTIGTQGTLGTQGDRGTRGSRGNRGTIGAQGTLGTQGPAGLRGSAGAAGVVGATGAIAYLYSVTGNTKPTTGSTGSVYIIGKDRQTDGWNGTFYVSQAYFINNELYEGSDERAKTFVSDIPVDFDELSNIPKKYFYWNEGHGNPHKLTIGTSAQELEKVYPEIVHEDSNGFKSVSYEKLGVIALAAIDKLNERIKKLESKLSETR